MTPEKEIMVSSDTPVGSDDVKDSINKSNKKEIADSYLDDTKDEVGVVSDSQTSEQEQTTEIRKRSKSKKT